MPSTITHDYHFKDTYEYSFTSFKKTFPQEFYDQHSVYAQGHDALFFSEFWKLHEFNKKSNQAIYLQDHKFQDFCIEFSNLLANQNHKNSKSLKLLLYGYIIHHILDSYTHPYIIYETETSGLHSLVESYIDKYMIEQRERTNSNTYSVHKLIPKPPILTKNEIELINKAFYQTYNFDNFGTTYINALNQVNLFLGLFRYDPTGIKNIVYSLIDKTNLTSLKFSFLSYNHNYQNFEQYLNEEHRFWYNPSDPNANICSTNSFLELYDLATKKAAEIISYLEEAINDKATSEELKIIVPNVSAIHGLECDLELPYKTLKKAK